MANVVAKNFNRVWNSSAGYCYDVIDAPGNWLGPYAQAEPDFAVSLPKSPLTPEQHKLVVDICARRLLTSHGLRNLDPRHTVYQCVSSGNRLEMAARPVCPRSLPRLSRPAARFELARASGTEPPHSRLDGASPKHGRLLRPCALGRFSRRADIPVTPTFLNLSVPAYIRFDKTGAT
jgi:glycogen debranching enzyme